MEFQSTPIPADRSAQILTFKKPFKPMVDTHAYIELSRLHKFPIGSLLIFWPSGTLLNPTRFTNSPSTSMGTYAGRVSYIDEFYCFQDTSVRVSSWQHSSWRSSSDQIYKTDDLHNLVALRRLHNQRYMRSRI